MSFATDYLAQLEAFAARGPLPRIRALHLPSAGGVNMFSANVLDGFQFISPCFSSPCCATQICVQHIVASCVNNSDPRL